MIQILDPNDIDGIRQVIELEREAFGPNGLDEWTLMPLVRHGRVFVLKEGEALLGAAEFLRDWGQPQTVYLFGVSIAAAHRSQGKGSHFLREVFRRLRNEGFRKVELTVDPANLAGVRVYRDKMGFRVLEFREAEYGQGNDRLAMELELD